MSPFYMIYSIVIYAWNLHNRNYLSVGVEIEQIIFDHELGQRVVHAVASFVQHHNGKN